jgi:hypothetical protein
MQYIKQWKNFLHTQSATIFAAHVPY